MGERIIWQGTDASRNPLSNRQPQVRSTAGAALAQRDETRDAPVKGGTALHLRMEPKVAHEPQDHAGT